MLSIDDKLNLNRKLLPILSPKITNGICKKSIDFTSFFQLQSTAQLKQLIEVPNNLNYIPGSAGVFMLSAKNEENSSLLIAPYAPIDPFVVIKPAFIPMDYDIINPPTHLEEYIVASLAKDFGLMVPDTQIIPKNTKLGNVIHTRLKEIPLYADKQKYATEHFYDPASFLLTAYIKGKSLNSGTLRPRLINKLQDQNFRYYFYKDFAKHVLFSNIVHNWDFFPLAGAGDYSCAKLNLSNILLLDKPVQNRYIVPIDMTIEAMSTIEFAKTKKLLIDLDKSNKNGSISEYTKFILKNMPEMFKHTCKQDELLSYIQEGLVESQKYFNENSDRLVNSFLCSYKQCRKLNNAINEGLTRFPNRLNISEKDAEMIVKTLKMAGHPYE